MATPQAQPWHANLPVPQRQPPTYSKETLLRQFIILQDILNAGTLLVDVRKDDYEGGTIRCSLNLPAQSFYFNMATLYRLCQGDGLGQPPVSRVMFYCNGCTPTGRGPRCAAWFADYIAARSAAEGKLEEPQVFILEGGIKGWVASGPQYTQFVDGYVPEYWLKMDGVKTAGKRIARRDDGDDDDMGSGASDAAAIKRMNMG